MSYRSCPDATSVSDCGGLITFISPICIAEAFQYHFYTASIHTSWATCTRVASVYMLQNKQPQPKPRTRTFNGCRTCRNRKVKCDLSRPVCKNCDRLRLQCRGYDSTLHWMPQWHLSGPHSHATHRGETDRDHHGRMRTELYSGCYPLTRPGHIW